jgi:hypothetical protein
MDAAFALQVAFGPQFCTQRYSLENPIGFNTLGLEMVEAMVTSAAPTRLAAPGYRVRATRNSEWKA